MSVDFCADLCALWFWLLKGIISADITIATPRADRILSSVDDFCLLAEPGKRRIVLVSMHLSKFVLIQPEIICLHRGQNAEYTSV